MRNLTMIVFAYAGLLISTLPQARADEWNQKTIFTFSGPVEIPGQVLTAGTYVFKLADSQSDRNIVQVFNKGESHLYGTFLTIPDYRLKPAGKPIITFEERSADSPEAVRAWFYPGENFGHGFVYPKSKAAQLAKANNTPVASMPNELAANTTKPAATMQEPHVVELKQAPLKAQQPTEEEVELAEVFIAQAPAPPSLPQMLPKTGSALPLIGLLGVLSIASGGLLSLRNARCKETK
jgi:LPXTG-motif cell wall-anchored protein